MPTTARLILRPPRLADVPALMAFLGDAAAMRWTHRMESERECRRTLAAHAWQRRRTGCAPCTLIERATGAIIGLGGLYEDPFDPGWGIELGYFLAPSAWGRGFATELAHHAVGVAERLPGLTRLRAFVHPENIGSRRVLEKAGFTPDRFVPQMNRFLLCHALAAPDGEPPRASHI